MRTKLPPAISIASTMLRFAMAEGVLPPEEDLDTTIAHESHDAPPSP